ncbi:MAG: 30S ribosomal protein S7 [Candidatus Yanofskybacteria bacterium RIFCSPHIGHO2_02_FULL_41_11]|uniref:Small ribosomal subunit protein uS7 n=1 Tax=Candidatus Yanofskybacteria bacterium RIFCSPHIGHO2_02_FULL_41_11 TaxID=1802675 RepID=A0A1F8FAA5_9BACT|nr:MAG: 30S ribosomal protein S7 [Candidatus Yanofskybacteria bacterium RIFCSPHIGHO2_02_FULL_41_11]
MRRPVKKRAQVEPDLKYSSVLISKLINVIMQDGKKATASKLVYSALEIAEKKLNKPALEIFEQALQNASPNVELKSRRIGGANYQVPIEVRPERKVALAFRWIREAARSQKGKPMSDKLAEEIINAYNNTGGAVKKKNDTHRMADANKAFAHFAW